MIEVSHQPPNGITIHGIGQGLHILHINDARNLLVQLETAIRIYDDLERQRREKE